MLNKLNLIASVRVDPHSDCRFTSRLFELIFSIYAFANSSISFASFSAPSTLIEL